MCVCFGCLVWFATDRNGTQGVAGSFLLGKRWHFLSLPVGGCCLLGESETMTTTTPATMQVLSTSLTAACWLLPQNGVNCWELLPWSFFFFFLSWTTKRTHSRRPLARRRPFGLVYPLLRSLTQFKVRMGKNYAWGRCLMVTTTHQLLEISDGGFVHACWQQLN
jgi:hypothetical protein